MRTVHDSLICGQASQQLTYMRTYALENCVKGFTRSIQSAPPSSHQSMPSCPPFTYSRNRTLHRIFHVILYSKLLVLTQFLT
eukprot:750963-Amphidinium_carterae.1